MRLQLPQLLHMLRVGPCGILSRISLCADTWWLCVPTFHQAHACCCPTLKPTQDGGGVTKDGGLPPAPTLFVSGERELVSELERIIDALNKGVAVDWEKR